MFGRATIRLGIGPHSSYVYFALCLLRVKLMLLLMKQINQQNVTSFIGGCIRQLTVSSS